VPGTKAEVIHLKVTGRNLTISGERKIKPEGENANYHRKKRESGNFSRVLALPVEIVANGLSPKWPA
jgi:HSP20 family protein